MTGRSRARSRLLLLAAIGVVVVGAAGYVAATTDNTPRVGISGAANGAFDRNGRLDASIERAWLSPDGAHVAVRTDAGIGIARASSVAPVTPGGASVVDAAWMPDASSLLVVEGPANADRLTVLDLNGGVRGVAVLDAPFSVGNGNGLAVDGRGARALAVTETRDAIGGRRHHDVVLVDLTTGHVTTVTDTPDADEAWPIFLDDDRILFARTSGGGTPVVIERTLASGVERQLSPTGEATRPVGVLRTGAAVLAGARPGKRIDVWVPTGGTHISLGHVGANDIVWGVDPAGSSALVASGPILRAVTLTPPPPR